MSRHPLFRRAASLCATAALAVVVIPAHADAGPRLFKATLTTQEVIGFDVAACPTAPFLRGTTLGTGQASLLGRVTLRATDCVVPGPTSFTFTGGTLVLTAANGDTVTADYSGSLIPSPDSSPSVLSGTFRVTGGTGRFAGATGSGYLSGTEALATGQGVYQVEGTLTY